MIPKVHDLCLNIPQSAEELYQLVNDAVTRITEVPGLNASVSVVGRSFHGVDIRMVTIQSAEFGDSGSSLLVVSGVHGREWISIASSACIVQQVSQHVIGEPLVSSNSMQQQRLSNSYSSQDATKEKHTLKTLVPRLVERIQAGELALHVIPVLNPDGYDFTQSRKKKQQGLQLNIRYTPRYWRKNRHVVPGRIGRRIGVDLNRNFGVAGYSWGFGTNSTRSELYQGTEPFSEPESRALRSVVLNLSEKAKRNSCLFGMIDLHCCSNNVLPPFLSDDSSVTGTKLETVSKNIMLSNLMQNRTKMIDSGISSIQHRINQTLLATVGQSMVNRMSKVQAAIRNVDSKLVPGCGKSITFGTRETSYSASNTGVALDWCVEFGGVDIGFIVEVPGYCRGLNDPFVSVFNTNPAHILGVTAMITSAMDELASVLVVENHELLIDPLEVVEKENDLQGTSEQTEVTLVLSESAQPTQAPGIDTLSLSTEWNGMNGLEAFSVPVSYLVGICIVLLVLLLKVCRVCRMKPNKEVKTHHQIPTIETTPLVLQTKPSHGVLLKRR